MTIRVHVIDADSGKTTTRKTYATLGPALKFAQAASALSTTRETRVYTGDGKRSTLVYRKGEAMTPVEPERNPKRIDDPRAYLAARMPVVDPVPGTAAEPREPAAVSDSPPRRKRVRPQRAAEFEAVYRQWCNRERRSPPRPELFGLTVEQAAASREVVKGERARGAPIPAAAPTRRRRAVASTRDSAVVSPPIAAAMPKAIKAALTRRHDAPGNDRIEEAVVADRARAAETLRARAKAEADKAAKHRAAADLLEALSYDLEAGRL